MGRDLGALPFWFAIRDYFLGACVVASAAHRAAISNQSRAHITHRRNRPDLRNCRPNRLNAGIKFWPSVDISTYELALGGIVWSHLSR